MQIRIIGIRKDGGGHWVEAGSMWNHPGMKTTLFIRRKSSDVKHFIQGWNEGYHVTKTEGFTQLEIPSEMLKALGLWGTNFNRGFPELIRQLKNRNHADRILIEFKEDTPPARRPTIPEALENIGKAAKEMGKSLSKGRKTGLARHELNTIADLETALYRECGVRMIIRLHPKTTINWVGKQVSDLNDKVTNKITGVRTVAQLRAAIREHVRPGLVGLMEGRELDKAEVDFISPNGVVVNGNTLVKNIRFTE